VTRSPRLVPLSVAVLCALAISVAAAAAAENPPPELTKPVNDFAGVVDAASAQQMDMIIRALQQASGDVVTVAVVDTYAPYADISEYAVKMFENHGHGIGQKGRDNGLLIVIAIKDRDAKIEVGYDLEQFITDGYAGETIRQTMAPYFKRGEYGPGLAAAVTRIVGRIAERRNVKLQGVQLPASRERMRKTESGGSVFWTLLVLFIVVNAIAGRLRRRRRGGRWGGGPWSGWSSGVGPFGGGGFGGFGGGGGGFGGGFGGFGGGRSGGGGASGSW
jgi:uncharacterized protein